MSEQALHGIRLRLGHRAGILLAVLWVGGASVAESPKEEQQSRATSPAIDPKAERILRDMSTFLGSQRQFSVRTEGTLEAVESGQKLQFSRAGQVHLSRPDKLHVERTGDLADLELYYDGKQLSLWGKRSNLYATTPAPPNIDAMLEVASERLGLEPPGGDLLYSQPYEVLTEDVLSGSYVGRSMSDGVPVHHLAFRGNQVDWQIWIEDGPQPVPRKYVITSKDMPQAPQYTVRLSEWNLKPEFSPAEFTFTPPEGAQQISFLAPQAEQERRSRRGGQKR